jgi:hypothetical protein
LGLAPLELDEQAAWAGSLRPPRRVVGEHAQRDAAGALAGIGERAAASLDRKAG